MIQMSSKKPERAKFKFPWKQSQSYKTQHVVPYITPGYVHKLWSNHRKSFWSYNKGLTLFQTYTRTTWNGLFFSNLAFIIPMKVQGIWCNSELATWRFKSQRNFGMSINIAANRACRMNGDDVSPIHPQSSSEIKFPNSISKLFHDNFNAVSDLIYGWMEMNGDEWQSIISSRYPFIPIDSHSSFLG